MNKRNRKLMEIKQSKLSHDRLVELFKYNPKTGIFINKANRGTRSIKGKEPGMLQPDGYLRIIIDKRGYPAHRLAWFYMFKKWPKDEMDHKNRVRNDNRISNLREATHSMNMSNTENKALKQSGIKGINWKEKDGAWAIIYKDKRLCSVQTVEEGIKMLSAAENGTFAKLPRRGCAVKQSGVVGIVWGKERNQWVIRHNEKYAGRRKTLAEAILLKLELADGEYVKGLRNLWDPK